MKKTSMLFAFVAIFFLLTSTVYAEKTLRISLQLPIKHHLGQNLLNFQKEVEKESNGSLKIEIYPSAQLYKDKEVPQAVASGSIEMGVASLTRFAGTIPAVDIFYVPFMFDSPEKVVKATAPGSTIRKALDEAILGTGTRVLWWQAYGSAILLTKKDIIKTPADMKGKKVRVFGKTLGDTVKAVGGAPTMMSGSKQFLAYQRGTVDAGMTGITAVKSRKLFEVMDYMTLTYNADIEFIVIISEKVWQGLSDKERSIISKAGLRVEKELREKMGKIEQETLAWSRDKIKVVDLTDAERNEWREATKSVVNSYMERAGELGKKLVAEANKL
ncbi:MAG: TRAP transporter substrate-binding protein DctP [Deltaproteobacteria bacterium]|nr:TRAP transporter substrate-binding protein DctP [Deltaproteobacteria bacterium]MBW2659241.1 TRAP transporter substrate-binding protein DctP [Deltaproteobacteria bacterium]